MPKSLQATLFASTLLLSSQCFAESPNCTETKFLAQQVFTMIQGGASLETTINAFEKTRFNTYMIKKIYSNKNIIKNTTNAEKSAVKSCKNYT